MQGIVVSYKYIITYFLPLRLSLLLVLPSPPHTPLTGSFLWLLLHLWLNRYLYFSPVFHPRLFFSSLLIFLASSYLCL